MIREIESEIIRHKKNENKIKEERVIENINKKPKMFYKFIKNQENRDTSIGPFKINGKYIYDKKDICNSLNALMQYKVTNKLKWTHDIKKD